MIRKKRGDTRVGQIEERYGIDLNARSDMHLGNLLRKRGFNSQSQLIKAYQNRLYDHARKRKIFLSFHAEDKKKLAGIRLMLKNPSIDLDFFDQGLREPVNSEQASYIKKIIRDKIAMASVVLCLIGDETASRDWVNWELYEAFYLRKGLCGVRLKNTHGIIPDLLEKIGAPIAKWDVKEIIRVIETAAARRT